ncbi:hypothetical protein MGWOODY_Clf305 [hydrothermal vent metagenome]|uniref:Uncharacterized protein n=1 Tax=hydrothermal vent metagenome TaxID=652676 RepID=A0A160V6D8_9ZZZZ
MEFIESPELLHQHPLVPGSTGSSGVSVLPWKLRRIGPGKDWSSMYSTAY